MSGRHLQRLVGGKHRWRFTTGRFMRGIVVNAILFGFRNIAAMSW